MEVLTMKLTARFVRNSKKAFTLVELVVVIAILAVIAAIAIPAVIGITNSATESKVETDAASIDSAVKTFHSGIVNGTIYQSNLPSNVASVAGASFPSENSSNGERAAYANRHATVQQAMQYAGIWDRLSSSIIGKDFGYAGGSVVAAVDGEGHTITATANGSAINVLTTGTEKINAILSY